MLYNFPCDDAPFLLSTSCYKRDLVFVNLQVCVSVGGNLVLARPWGASLAPPRLGHGASLARRVTKNG